MGWGVPTFAHLPLIHGPDGGKFSKRHGAQSVEEYKDMGYLSEAMFNYLLRLGWSHGDDEFITRNQALEWFSLSGLGKSSANFDFTKLENLNAHYIKEKNINDLIEISKPIFYQNGLTLSPDAINRITQSQDEIKSRSKTLHDFVNESAFYCTSDLEFEEKAAQTIKDNIEILGTIQASIADISDLTKENAMAFFKEIANDHADGKLGKVGMPLRAALTGKTSSISVFEAAAILGKEETCARLQKAISKFS